MEPDTHRFPLDYSGRVLLDVQRDDASGKLILSIEPQDSRLSKALMAMIRVDEEDGIHQPPPKADKLRVPMPGAGEDLKISFNGHPFLYLRHPAADRWEVPSQSQRLLTSTECRMIGRAPQTEFPAAEEPGADNLSTDLHTHLSSQLTGRQLVEIGIAHQTMYPISILDQLGVVYPQGQEHQGEIPYRVFLPEAHMLKGPPPKMQPAVALSVKRADGAVESLLSPADEATLATSFDLSNDNQSVFGDLEQRYHRREPFTKNLALLPDMLRAVAEGYKRGNSNFKYAELSTNAITDPGWMEAIGPVVKDIEIKTGVRLRFLAGIPRNLDDEKLQKRIADIIDVAKDSKYVVGVDWLGYETNRTSDIDHHIRQLAEWTRANRPDWVQRIHAGENSKNQHSKTNRLNNVEHCLKLVKELGVLIRIGHATHGVSEKTAEEAHALHRQGYNFYIETLPDSNIATNTIDYPGDTSVKLFVKKEVPTLVGSDGAGMYGTDTAQSAHSARLAGLNKKDFGFLQDTEARFLSEQRARESAFDLGHKACEAYRGTVPPRIEMPLQAAVQSLPALDSLPQDARRPIFIPGSNGTSWERMPEEEKQKTLKYFQTLIFGGRIDPRKHYLVLGRMKDEGLGHEIASMVYHYNRVLYQTGMLSMAVEEIPPGLKEAVTKDGASDAASSALAAETPPLDCIVIGTDPLIKPLPKGVSGYYHMHVPLVYVPERMMQLLRDQQGGDEGPPIVIPGGGGTFTRDMIMLAKDAGWPVAPLDVQGASQEKGRIYQEDVIKEPAQLQAFEKRSGLSLLKEGRDAHHDWTRDMRTPPNGAT